MGRKQPKSWADKLEKTAEEPHVDPLIQKINDQLHRDPPQDFEIVGLERQLLRSRVQELEIRNKELEMGLYLAKAKIAELELAKLKGEQS